MLRSKEVKAIWTLDHMREMTDDQKHAFEMVKAACRSGVHLANPDLIPMYERIFKVEISKVVHVAVGENQMAMAVENWDGLVAVWCGRHCYGVTAICKKRRTLKETLNRWMGELCK